MHKSCDCNVCKNACNYHPEWFLPDEIEKVAKFMHISIKDLFDKYLAVDWWVASPNIFLISPAIVGIDTGTEYPSDPRGKCIFLENSKCKIYGVHPFECQEYMHTDSTSTVQERHKTVAYAWKNQKLVVKLLGREPCATMGSLFDMFSLFG